jgi:hypothetical protein
MSYRDDLDAALARAEALKGQVEALERGEALREARGKVAALEAQLAAARTVPAGEAARMVLVGGCVPFVLGTLAISMAVDDIDRVAWWFANVAVLAGIFAGGWAWGRVGAVRHFVAAIASKAAIVGIWIGGWWDASAERLGSMSDGPALTFFWAAPAVLTIVNLVEGALAWRVLARRRAR